MSGERVPDYARPETTSKSRRNAFPPSELREPVPVAEASLQLMPVELVAEDVRSVGKVLLMASTVALRRVPPRLSKGSIAVIATHRAHGCVVNVTSCYERQ